LGFALLNCVRGQNRALPPVSVAESSFHFDVVGADAPVEHTFAFTNNTSELLHPNKASVTKPLIFDTISPRVNPGDEGFVRVHLGSPRKYGDFKGAVEVSFKNPGVSNITFDVSGKITPYVEISPIPAFFVAVQRGRTNEAALQLINHERAPLRILGIEHASSRFKTHLQTNEPGQRYTLWLTLPGDGKPGHLGERIIVRTSSLKRPVLAIAANTMIKERVNTFPQDVDFASVNLTALRKSPASANLLAQTLMVYQHGGTNFEVTAKVSLPFLRVDSEQGQSRDRWQFTIRPNPDEMGPGAFHGNIVLQTNDPEFSWVNVPVHIIVTEGVGRSQASERLQPR
jgi:hypothetical protein